MSEPRIVELDPTRSTAAEDEDWLARAAERATDAAGNVVAALKVAQDFGTTAPLPGTGQTARLWSLLATIAAGDLTVARVVEPHLDALAILGQSGREALPDEIWGVYAAERPGTVLEASDRRGQTTLDGVKPWCSLAGTIDRALISARFGETRQLFSVDLRLPGVAVEEGTWHARGLADVASSDVRFDNVPAQPIGAPGWYLDRPGFAWGGIGVAACWYGATAALAEALLPKPDREPDQIALAALGRADRMLHASRLSLADAARAVDAGLATGAAGVLLAARVRGVVAEAAEQILLIAGRALGPAPLTFNEEHARRVADLTVYVRQHHGARDDANLGRAIQRAARPPGTPLRRSERSRLS